MVSVLPASEPVSGTVATPPATCTSRLPSRYLPSATSVADIASVTRTVLDRPA